jgi:hypothetical protein
MMNSITVIHSRFIKMYRLIVMLLLASFAFCNEVTRFLPEPTPPDAYASDPEWVEYNKRLQDWERKCCVASGRCKKRAFWVAGLAALGTVGGEALSMLSTCHSPKGGCK